MSAAAEMLERLPFGLEDAAGAAKRIGLVTLSTDYSLELELRAAMAVAGVEWFVARIANSPVITPETLAAMGPGITATAGLILPGDRLDVVAFACTSATILLGAGAVAERLEAAKPGARSTDPASASLRALAALGAKRVGVLTPYRRDVNEGVLAWLGRSGLDIPVFASFNEEDDRNVARIDAASIAAAVRRLAEGRALDAVFISCTTVRALAAIPAIEAENGLPVISANQALAWDCLRLCGALAPRPGLGRLFALPAGDGGALSGSLK